ncbi:LysR family transcriptional regulator [Labrys sp. ZIDIC5]|uniref:LysR family transcriptional regulator n=1 Tax=Labrys sedimenti TaxID=3106036 RepID=UPI002ACA2B32|nr:LysR family transcriptional regulator [Labrys sp. ZIDIC5]MDZ5449847.1 LysR family transcriptional regulator [Labrys sp. ZIDIC5]
MKRTDLPSLVILSAIAEQRSFRAAARKLGMSVSAVSQAITGLEESLGVRLLARTTRSVAPTAAGERLLGQLQPALASIEEALEQASASQADIAGRLRFSAPRTVVQHVLLPLALRFMRRYPAVSVEILAQDAFTDIVASGFDAGIRFGESLQQDMIAVPLGGPLRFAIVGAPGYLDSRRRPELPADLHDHDCIQRRFTDGSLYRWELERDGKAVELAVTGNLIVNDDALMLDAALAGQGLALLIEGLAAEALAQGRLVRLMEDWCPAFPGLFLYYPSRRLMRPALRTFVDFLKAEA